MAVLQGGARRSRPAGASTGSGVRTLTFDDVSGTESGSGDDSLPAIAAEPSAFGDVVMRLIGRPRPLPGAQGGSISEIVLVPCHVPTGGGR